MTTLVSYYPGCALHGTAREYDESTKAVAGLLGVELLELPDWNCCGASSAHATEEGLARPRLPEPYYCPAAGQGPRGSLRGLLQPAEGRRAGLRWRGPWGWHSGCKSPRFPLVSRPPRCPGRPEGSFPRRIEDGQLLWVPPCAPPKDDGRGPP